MEEHAIRTNLGPAPGLGTEQTGFQYQLDGASQELIQVLDRDLDGAFFIHCHSHRVAVGVRMIAQGGEEVTQATFCGVDIIYKAETFRIVGLELFGQVVQSFGPAPSVSDLPAQEQEDGYRVKGNLASRRGPTQALSQDRTQPGEIDQSQDEVKIG